MHSQDLPSPFGEFHRKERPHQSSLDQGSVTLISNALRLSNPSYKNPRVERLQDNSISGNPRSFRDPLGLLGPPDMPKALPEPKEEACSRPLKSTEIALMTTAVG